MSVSLSVSLSTASISLSLSVHVFSGWIFHNLMVCFVLSRAQCVTVIKDLSNCDLPLYFPDDGDTDGVRNSIRTCTFNSNKYRSVQRTMSSLDLIFVSFRKNTLFDYENTRPVCVLNSFLSRYSCWLFIHTHTWRSVSVSLSLSVSLSRCPF